MNNSRHQPVEGSVSCAILFQNEQFLAAFEKHLTITELKPLLIQIVQKQAIDIKDMVVKINHKIVEDAMSLESLTKALQTEKITFEIDINKGKANSEL